MVGAPRTWSRAETVLAFDLAVAALRHVDAWEPSVVALSRILRSTDDGRFPLRHRNAHGVACKVNRLIALLNGGSPRGGAKLEAEIVAQFRDRPTLLGAAVIEARAALGAVETRGPSRGPVPAFGDFAVSREDGATWVYLARLGGARMADGRLLAKIGRSADVARRMAELDGGLPEPLGLHWHAMATWLYDDAGSAHVAEQAMLAHYGRAGLCVGGEFLAVDDGELAEIARCGPGVTGRSDRRRPPSVRARRDPRAARTRRRVRRAG